MNSYNVYKDKIKKVMKEQNLSIDEAISLFIDQIGEFGLGTQIWDKLKSDILLEKKSSNKKTIAIDFDGVIADYSQGFQGVGIFGDILPDAKIFIDRLKNEFNIIIFTARGEIDDVKNYLDKNEVYYDKINENMDNVPDTVSDKKVIADIYLDDRAIRFKSWGQSFEDIKKYSSISKIIKKSFEMKILKI